ncbi:hypothetical protein ACP70R_033582 [Stipagrostis hirtigluma subsp. patula]
MSLQPPADGKPPIESMPLLADVLRRLPPRALAASRCVCGAWRATIDGRCLLRADLLLPHSVRGIFLMYHDLDFPAFLSRPSSAGPHISSKLQLLPGLASGPGPSGRRFASVVDHCNGNCRRRTAKKLQEKNS